VNLPSFRAVSSLLASTLLVSCASTENVRLPATLSAAGEEEIAAAPAGPGVFLGLTLEANESDSLDKLEVLPGARVAAASGGGPAARAGLQPGDVILAVNGTEIGDRDAFEAAAQSAAAGDELELEVRRATRVFAARLTAETHPGGAPPVELYQADPLRLRAGFRTELIEHRGERTAVAVLVRLFPESPLHAAGVTAGERILALEGKRLASARDLVRRLLEEHAYGERVTLTRIAAGGEEEEEFRVALWAPPRRLARVWVPIIFHYDSKLRPRRTEVKILHFWLFSVFAHLREEEESEIRIFGLFRFRSGYGELVEHGGEPERA
jgi:S1-C subfamily serine protease